MVGGAAGLVAGDPTMGLLPAALGTLVGGTVGDVLARKMSSDEKRRMGQLLRETSARIQVVLDEGVALRSDDFFEDDLSGRSRAKELTEAVLFAAQRCYEERKLPHIANLLAASAFSPQVDAPTLNWALKQAEDLTWIQFVLLAVVGSDDYALPDGEIGAQRGSWSSWGVHNQLSDLGYGKRQLLGAIKTSPIHGLTSPDSRMPNLKLSNGGKLLHNLLALDEVQAADVAAVLATFDEEPATT